MQTLGGESTRHPTLDRVSRLLVHIAGLALVAMAFVITISAILRKFASYAISGVDEIATYVFAIASTFAFGFAVLERAHVRIDILRGLVPPRVKVAMDVLAWAVFVLVFAVLTERAASLAWESWQNGDRSVTILRTPLAWPQALWAFGLAFTCLVALALGWRAVRHRTAAPLAPASEVDEEIARTQSGLDTRMHVRLDVHRS